LCTRPCYKRSCISNVNASLLYSSSSFCSLSMCLFQACRHMLISTSAGTGTLGQTHMHARARRHLHMHKSTYTYTRTTHTPYTRNTYTTQSPCLQTLGLLLGQHPRLLLYGNAEAPLQGALLLYPNFTTFALGLISPLFFPPLFPSPSAPPSPSSAPPPFYLSLSLCVRSHEGCNPLCVRKDGGWRSRVPK
jgi:hypothetical protein